MAGLPDLIHTQLRDRAQREICAELGLGEPVIVHTDYSGDDGAHATRRLISSAARPTAVIYDNDIVTPPPRKRGGFSLDRMGSHDGQALTAAEAGS
ncbi:hypothetical protein ABZV07_26765, partial [Streptomyces sp. NPDC005231]